MTQKNMIQITLTQAEFEGFLEILNDRCPQHFKLSEFVHGDECDELYDTGNCKECWKKSLRVKPAEDD